MGSHKITGMMLCMVSLVIICMTLGCVEKTVYTVTSGDRHGLQEGDHLYMNEVAIGSLIQVDLQSPGVVAAKVRLDKDYATFIKTSAIFTWADDPNLKDRSCLICKNCDEMAPVAEPSAVFEAKNFLSYTLACIGQTADKTWLKFMRDSLEKSAESGQKLSQDAKEKIETFARTNRKAFEEVLHDLNDVVEDLNQDTQDWLEEMRRLSRE